MIGDRIKERRIELEMTQTELATRVGYGSKVSVSKIESNQRDVPREKIVAFAEALHCDISYLLELDEEPASVKEAILIEVNNMNEKQREELLRYAKYLRGIING